MKTLLGVLVLSLVVGGCANIQINRHSGLHGKGCAELYSAQLTIMLKAARDHRELTRGEQTRIDLIERDMDVQSCPEEMF